MAKGLLGLFENLFSKKNKDVAKLRPTIELIKEGRTQYAALSDDELKHKRVEFAGRFEAGETLDDLLVEA